MSLVDCACWDIGERIELPKKYKGLVYFDPLFIYTPGKAVAVYYNFTDLAQSPERLIDYLEKHKDWFKQEKETLDEDCRKMKSLMKDGSEDYKELITLNHEIWPTIAVANLLGITEIFPVSNELKTICVQIRTETDNVLHPSLTYINSVIAKKLNIGDAQNLLLSEIMSGQMPTDDKLKEREQGWMYHKGQLIFDREKYFKENNIELVDPTKGSVKVLKGNVACKGFAKGSARIVYELSELDKVQDGDVIVTPMTTPEMIPVLKKVSAIVTDEGGITCHAAIVSREMNIPCVIGTLDATRLLHDGDTLEVNADEGTVRVLD